jgi:hypothetical protein
MRKGRDVFERQRGTMRLHYLVPPAQNRCEVAAPLGRILAGAPAVYLRGVENVLDPAGQSLRRHLLGLPNRRQGGRHGGPGDFISWGDPKSS